MANKKFLALTGLIPGKGREIECEDGSVVKGADTVKRGTVVLMDHGSDMAERFLRIGAVEVFGVRAEGKARGKAKGKGKKK